MPDTVVGGRGALPPLSSLAGMFPGSEGRVRGPSIFVTSNKNVEGLRQVVIAANPALAAAAAAASAQSLGVRASSSGWRQPTEGELKQRQAERDERRNALEKKRGARAQGPAQSPSVAQPKGLKKYRIAALAQAVLGLAGTALFLLGLVAKITVIFFGHLSVVFAPDNKWVEETLKNTGAATVLSARLVFTQIAKSITGGVELRALYNTLTDYACALNPWKSSEIVTMFSRGAFNILILGEKPVQTLGLGLERLPPAAPAKAD